MTKIIGITGGIGSGKTTLSNHLKKLGYSVHESDSVVSDIYKKPKKTFLNFIKKNISMDAVKKNKIDKKKIANIIFSNKNIKTLFEKYIHKEVRLSREVFVKKNSKKKKKIIFADIPLLFEKNLDKNFYSIVCVISSKKNRINRVLKNKKFSKETLDKILKFQISDKERRKRSRIIITNNKTKKDFIFNIEKALMELIK